MPTAVYRHAVFGLCSCLSRRVPWGPVRHAAWLAAACIGVPQGRVLLSTTDVCVDLLMRFCTTRLCVCVQVALLTDYFGWLGCCVPRSSFFFFFFGTHAIARGSAQLPHAQNAMMKCAPSAVPGSFETTTPRHVDVVASCGFRPPLRLPPRGATPSPRAPVEARSSIVRSCSSLPVNAG